MSLPKRTTILIVGAGPSGLSAAISLVKNGAATSDIIVVDAVETGANSSRALTIHASTLEMLDSVGVADALITEGIKGQGFWFSDRVQTDTPLIYAEFSSLAPYTRFPYILIIPQNVTERILLDYAQGLGITVLRPFKVTDVKHGGHEDGTLDVSFESGEVLRTKYIVGADGHKSVIRTTAGITFADPDGECVDDTSTQMVFADVIFDSDLPQVRSDRLNAFSCPAAFLGLIPLLTSWHHPDADKSKIVSGTTVFRLGVQVPHSDGVPPSKPSTEYLQELINKYGPIFLSSDPTANPKPVKILETVWSTRYRTHASIASTFFTRFEGSGKSGIILLVGDSAHIHNPAGGMGMNLGIRDAIGLGSVIVQHMVKSKDVLPAQWTSKGIDRCLKEYTDARYKRAISTIRLAKRLLSIIGGIRGKRFITIQNAFIRFIGRFQLFRRALAWRISGLAFK